MKRLGLLNIFLTIIIPFQLISASEVVPENWFMDSICDSSDIKLFQPILAALQSTKDDDLTELFVALSKNRDKKIRLMAVMALGDLENSLSTNALEQRLEKDTVMAIRAESLVYLLNRNQADSFLLKTVLSSRDENIRCIAARALSRKTANSNSSAITTLKGLVSSNDQTTSALSQTSLLAAGYGEYYAPLEKIFLDKKADISVIRLVLRQIAEEKIIQAAPLAIHILQGDYPKHIQVLAARAVANATPENLRPLFNAIRKSSSTVFRISVLRELSECPGASPYLQTIAKSNLTVGRIAEFELARKSCFSKTNSPLLVKKAIMSGHPVAINFILQRAREDIKEGRIPSNVYVPAFINFIKSVNAYSKQMTSQHILAAQASELLVEIGGDEAINAIQNFLNERYSSRLRAVSAGLIHCKNPIAAKLVRRFINYPYLEISSNAALTLGHFGDKAAEKYFFDIIKDKDTNSRELVTLACWYWLKINDKHKETVRIIINRLEQN